VDYATGYTPMKMKQKSQDKINGISASHDAALEKELSK
jgi:hypothetical protein